MVLYMPENIMNLKEKLLQVWDTFLWSFGAILLFLLCVTDFQ